MKIGKVYLVGAGCGSTGLLTIKALELLLSCDVVLYDNLIPKEVLTWTRKDCEKVDVGKRYGGLSMKQQDIQDLLIKKAREGKTVVRLKGGDPYIFGRGGEEFLAVKKAGIDCEQVPGISSAFAVPAAAGIPVTHRKMARSVTVVTGTIAGEHGQEQLQLDFETLAKLEGTLVILMGIHHVEAIADGLIRAGKDPNTPCAVIMEGTTQQQRCLRTILVSVAQESKAQGFHAPAVIVIGPVAELELLSKKEQAKEEKATTQRESLSGVTVGVTGTPHFVKKLSTALWQQKAYAWDMGFMDIVPTQTPLPDLAACGWIVFTSPNGAHIFLDKCRQEQRDLRSLSSISIAVIGPGTAQVFEEAGIYVDYMPPIYDTTHLAKGLIKRIIKEQKHTSLFPLTMFLRSQEGSTILPALFQQQNLPFVDVPLYNIEVQKEKRAVALQKKSDYVVFGSAMGVRAYFEGIEEQTVEYVQQTNVENHRKKSLEPRYLCVGDRCKEELEKYTTESILTAKEASIEGIVSCLYEDRKRNAKKEDIL